MWKRNNMQSNGTKQGRVAIIGRVIIEGPIDKITF